MNCLAANTLSLCVRPTLDNLKTRRTKSRSVSNSISHMKTCQTVLGNVTSFCVPFHRLRRSLKTRTGHSVCTRAVGSEGPSTLQMSQLVRSCPTWTDLDALTSLIQQESAEGMPVSGAQAAAQEFNRDSAWEIIDDPAVLESCVGVFGDLEQAQQIADEHIRLLVDCLLRDTAMATETFYAGFAKLPPFYQKEREVVSVAVGSATLNYIREEQEIFCALLGEVELADLDFEGQQKARIAKALCKAIDMISESMPEQDDDE